MLNLTTSLTPAGADGGMSALLELRDQGVLKYIGLGCVDREQQLQFLEHSPVADCILTVNDYNLVRRFAADELFPVTAQKVGTLADCVHWLS